LEECCSADVNSLSDGILFRTTEWKAVLSDLRKFGRWTKHVDQFGPAVLPDDVSEEAIHLRHL
jgi:hypothetical protein